MDVHSTQHERWSAATTANGAAAPEHIIFGGLLVFLLVLTGILGTTGNSLLNDGDTSMHILVGQQIWRTGAFPTADTFSWTFAGHRWIAKEWLSQLILFAAYSFASWRGVILVTAMSLALTYTLLFAVLARELRLTVALGVALLAIAFSASHFLARPHVFSFPVIVLWIAGLVSAVEKNRHPSLLLLPAMTLWANLHAGFTLGLALAGVFALEAIVRAEAEKRVRVILSWIGFLVAAIVAACITPYGYEPLTLSFRLYGGQPVELIGEWAPLTAVRQPIIEMIMLALLGLSLCFGTRLKLFRVVILIGLVHLTFKHLRMAPMLAIIGPIAISSSLAEQYRFLRIETHMRDDPRLFALLRRFANPSICALLIVATVLTSAAYLSRPSTAPKDHLTLKDAVDFMERENLTTRIGHSYEFASYLMFRGVKVLIDSRLDQLYTGGFFARTYNALYGFDGGLIPFFEKYRVLVALVKPGSAEASQLLNAKDWRTVYSDSSAIVLRLDREKSADDHR